MGTCTLLGVALAAVGPLLPAVCWLLGSKDNNASWGCVLAAEGELLTVEDRMSMGVSCSVDAPSLGGLLLLGGSRSLVDVVAEPASRVRATEASVTEGGPTLCRLVPGDAWRVELWSKLQPSSDRCQ